MAACSRTPDAPRRACDLTQPVEPWFPIDHLQKGFIVAGTQTAGDPGVKDGSEFAVSDILAFK
jgi:hypothetical protein